MNSGCRPLAEAILSSQTHMAGTPAGWWLSSWQSDGKASVAGTLSCPPEGFDCADRQDGRQDIEEYRAGRRPEWAAMLGNWTAGDTVEVTLSFSEAVTVDTAGGTPSVGLLLGGTTERRATYRSGSGTPALVFEYTLTDSDGTHTSVLVPRGQPGAGRGNDPQHGDAGPRHAHPPRRRGAGPRRPRRADTPGPRQALTRNPRPRTGHSTVHPAADPAQRLKPVQGALRVQPQPGRAQLQDSARPNVRRGGRHHQQGTQALPAQQPRLGTEDRPNRVRRSDAVSARHNRLHRTIRRMRRRRTKIRRSPEHNHRRPAQHKPPIANTTPAAPTPRYGRGLWGHERDPGIGSPGIRRALLSRSTSVGHCHTLERCWSHENCCPPLFLPARAVAGIVL